MTSTTSTTLRRRRLAAAVLALPLSLAMTGAAFATGTTGESLGAATAELRTASAGGSAADAVRADGSAARVATAAADTSAADKAAEAKAAAAKAAAAKAAAAKAAEAKAASDRAAAAKAAADAAAAARKAAPAATGSAAGAASGKSAAAATTTNTTFVNGNTNSSKADRPNAPVAGTSPTQPLSNADKNGTGANPGSTCTHNYCSNGTGLEPGNGNDAAPAKGQPCAGCVGKADNKNPKGQAPSGPVDRNAGYECDRNQGIGQSNPAHTGCTGTPTTPPTTPPFDACPNMSGNQPAGTPCNNGGNSGGGGIVDVCPDMPGKQPVGTTCKDDGKTRDKAGNGKITICHATGSATNPYVVITVSTNGLNGHGDHEDDIIPAPASGVCPGGTGGNNGGGGSIDVCPDMPGKQPVGTTCKDDGKTPDKGDNGKITICHATGSATNPYVVITVSTNGLNGHGDHEGDIIPAPANGICPTGTTTFDQCPDMAGNQPAGTICLSGGGGGAGSNPAVDVCPDTPGMQQMGPCVTAPTEGGGTPALTPPGDNAPIEGVTPNQPATNPRPMGPPTFVPPVIVPNGNVQPTLIGTVTSPATLPAPSRAAANRPRALPFTGTDAALLVELGGLLLLAGGGLLLAARRERTARTAA